MIATSPTPLARRLAWMTALRIGLLTALLTLVGFLYLHPEPDTWALLTPGAFSLRVLLVTLGIGFALAAVALGLLRTSVRPQVIAYGQLLCDQATWTILAYVSGGVTSGATSLYGLSCVAGAILAGVPGVIVAAVSATVCFLTLTMALLRGWLLPPADQNVRPYVTLWADAAYPVTLNLLVLVVVALLAAYLAERLRKTGGQLATATARAEQAERLALLGRFTAGLAHELRNPLGAIAGSIDMLAGLTVLSPEDRLLCDIISRETSRLNDLVSDMLDLCRPRSPVPVTVDVAVAASEVTTLAARSGRGSDLRLCYEGLTHGILVQADDAQLRQLLWNLVRNAVQASPPGEEILVRVHRDEDGSTTLAVNDHGPGISEADRPHLFEAFFTSRTHGIGVGLAVVKRIADDHGWTIDVENRALAGATGAMFRVTLPPSHRREN